MPPPISSIKSVSKTSRTSIGDQSEPKHRIDTQHLLGAESADSRNAFKRDVKPVNFQKCSRPLSLSAARAIVQFAAIMT